MRNRILGLEPIRVFAFFLIFMNHTFDLVQNAKFFDYGGRGVEIFFVLGGFLTAYNHYDKCGDGGIAIKDCLLFCKKKILKLYPLHLITFLLAAILIFRNLYLHFNPGEAVQLAISAILNLTLLQSWFNFSAWGFNGVSWFLSSIMFCYFITPFVLKWEKKIDNSSCGGIGGILLTLFIVVVFKMICDTIGAIIHVRWLEFALYVSPLYRSLDFIVGILGGILFLHSKFIATAKSKILDFTLSCLQISMCIGYLLAIYLGDGKWIAEEFVLVTLVLIYSMAINTSFTQMISRRWVLFLSSISFECYLLHQVFVLYWVKFYGYLCKHAVLVDTSFNKHISWSLIFFITIAFGYLAHKYLPKVVTHLARKTT